MAYDEPEVPPQWQGRRGYQGQPGYERHADPWAASQYPDEPGYERQEDPWAASQHAPNGRPAHSFQPASRPGRQESPPPPGYGQPQPYPGQPQYAPPPQRRPRRRRTARYILAGVGGLVVVIVAVIVAANGGHSAKTPGATGQTTAAAQAPASARVPAVPGSDGNQYVTGPFTVTLKGIGALPAQYLSETEQGQPIPENCAVVDVKNTSHSFTGWVSPDVEFVKGHSLSGQVLGTAPGDPSGGSDGGQSDPLSPGQSQVLYACPSGIGSPTYVEAQLISVTYGTPTTGTIDGTTVRLKY